MLAIGILLPIDEIGAALAMFCNALNIQKIV
jgi:hypothetical protein